jgi:hypothetical protein
MHEFDESPSFKKYIDCAIGFNEPLDTFKTIL